MYSVAVVWLVVNGIACADIIHGNAGTSHHCRGLLHLPASTFNDADTTAAMQEWAPRPWKTKSVGNMVCMLAPFLFESFAVLMPE